MINREYIYLRHIDHDLYFCKYHKCLFLISSGKNPMFLHSRLTELSFFAKSRIVYSVLIAYAFMVGLYFLLYSRV